MLDQLKMNFLPYYANSGRGQVTDAYRHQRLPTPREMQQVVLVQIPCNCEHKQKKEVHSFTTYSNPYNPTFGYITLRTTQKR